MKIILKEFNSVPEAYDFLDIMTREGHLPLELSPYESGCRVLVLVQKPTSEEIWEVADEVIQAYIGLNKGQIKSYYAVVSISNLLEGIKLAQELWNKDVLVHEIRVFKRKPGPHYLVVSHDSRELLESSLTGKSYQILEKSNQVLTEFLGLSDIAINGEL